MLEIILKNVNWLYFKLRTKFVKISPQNASQFIRLEDKYIISDQLADSLIAILKTHLTNASPVPDTEFTLIESIYLDNSKLQTLVEYLSQVTQRSKLRTRRYAPNAKWSDDIYIELKSKNHGISRKSRLIINETHKFSLFGQQGLNIEPSLLNLNTNVSRRKIQKRLFHINFFVENLMTVPMCKIAYSRQAFEKNDFRVTLDKDISFEIMSDVPTATINQIKSNPAFIEIMQNVQKNYATNFHVLEVKHSGKIPDWLTEFLAQHNVVKTGFSKYCCGMSFLFNKEQNYINSQNMKSETK